MRGVRFLFSALIALALAGCLHRQQTSYIVDPATGQAIPVVQAYPQSPAYPYPGYGGAGEIYAPSAAAPPSYAAQPRYSAPQYAAPAAAAPAAPRRLYSSSPAAAQQSYGEPAPVYAQPSYPQTYAAPAPVARETGPTGLFGFLARKSRPQVVYAAAPGAAYASTGYGYAATGAADPAYTLGSGDKLRIVVFGQDGITNSYLVGADGNVNLPLVGNVPARGFTTAQLAQMVAERLKQGYVREPHVSVEVEAYRPFFILGEVTTPGQYPYVANMTAETAIAIAGGFSPRADKRKVQLTRTMPGQLIKGDVPLSYPLRPGDTIVVKERWF